MVLKFLSSFKTKKIEFRASSQNQLKGSHFLISASRMSSLPNSLLHQSSKLHPVPKYHSISPDPQLLPKPEITFQSSYANLHVYCVSKISSKERLRRKIIESQSRQSLKVNWAALK